jgi:nucleoside-diphosphate-sugar epimerase
MNILITGAMGNVGPAVVDRLVRHGHHVKVIDRNIENDKILPGVEYAQGDVTNYAFLREQIKGCQAVIHLAAYAYPAAAAGQEIFRVNCGSAYNVYEAAAQEGIRRVVCASSINALGFNFGVKSFEIRYFPIDEEHPGFTTDAYSFSKQILEEVAAYYWRRDGISGACLRLPFVVPQPRADMPFNIQEFVERVRRGYHKLLDLPAQEREQRVQRMVAHFDQLRAERAFEKPWDRDAPPPPPEDDTMEEMHLGYSDFWTVIHPDDSAQAFEKAVLASYSGSHPLYVNSGQNWIGIPSESLAGAFYAGVTSRKRPVNGLESLVNIDKARALIGYEPEHPMGLS